MSHPRYALPGNEELGVALERRRFGQQDRTWTNSEFGKLIGRAMAEEREDYILALYLARYAGLRIHECFRMDTAAAERALRENALTVKGKSGKVRIVPIEDDRITMMNEFIDKAVSFYADWLSANRNDMLPRAISSAMDGRLKILEKNLSSLSFNHAVELDMLMGIIADTMQIDRDDLKRRRAQSVKNVKSTNGRISLEKRAQLWDETTDWDDDEWQS